MALLSASEIEQRLERVPDWQRDGDEIRRSLRLPTFARAIEFVNAVAALADEADHHPDIDIRYDRVDLALSTHSAGGLTRRDFDLAEQIDRLPS